MTTEYVPAQFSGNPTTAQLNAELTKIRNALDNCLQRARGLLDPEVSFVNQMHTDLDLNGNKILNVETDPNDPTSLVTVAALNDITGFDATAITAQVETNSNGLDNLQQLALINQANILTNTDGLAAATGISTQLQADLQALQVSLAQTNNIIDNVDVVVGQNQTDITALQTEVVTLTNQLASIFTQLQNNDTDIAQLTALVNQNIASFVTVDNQLASLLSQIQSNDAELAQSLAFGNENRDRIIDLENAVDPIEKSLSFNGLLTDGADVANIMITQHCAAELGIFPFVACTVAPAGGTALFTLYKNGLSFAQASIADGTLVGSYSTLPNETVFAPGDVILVRANAQNGAENVFMTLVFAKRDAP